MKLLVCFALAIGLSAQTTYNPWTKKLDFSGAAGSPATAALIAPGTQLDITHTYAAADAQKASITCFTSAGVVIAGTPTVTVTYPDSVTIRITFGSSQATGTKCNASAAGAGSPGAAGANGTNGTNGINGDTGAPGDPGPAGTNGSNGSNGEVTDEALQSGRHLFGTDAGGDDAYAVTLAPAPTAYDSDGVCVDGEVCDGEEIRIRVSTGNTGAAAIVVNGLTSKAIKMPDGTDPADGQVVTTAVNALRWNRTGDYWQIAGGASSGGGAGDVTGVTVGTGMLCSNCTGPVPALSPDTAVLADRAQVQSGTDTDCRPTGASATAYACNMTGNALTAYTTRGPFRFTPDVDCGASPTLDVDTRGIKNLKEDDGATAMNCRTAVTYLVVYDGTSIRKAGGTSQTKSLGITVDGGGSTITTGAKGFIAVPFACTISSWSVVGDVSGSIVLDVLKGAGVIPTVSITASAKPTLSSAQLAVQQAVTGWTTAVAAGDVLGFNVDSATTIKRATLTIACRR